MRTIKGQSSSNIEYELTFKKWCRRNGVDLFLFDGDDTLWATHEIFEHHMNRCYGYLAGACPTLSRAAWKKEVERINNACFERVGVSPTRWNMVMRQLAEEQELARAVMCGSLEILMQIYQTPPKFLEGAEEYLTFMKNTGIDFGIVTHADTVWTRQKYKWLKLDRFIKWDDIYCVEPNGHKTADSWTKAIAYFGRTPNQCAVVGDSPRTDINASGEAGVIHRFCIEAPNRWSVHNQKLDSNVWKIKGVNDLRRLGYQCLTR